MQPVIILILILAFALAGHGSSSTLPIGPAVADPSWTIAYSRVMPPTLSERAGIHFFDFPTDTDGIHYVIKRAPTVQLGQTITMVFSLEGRGKLLPNEGRSPAKVRLFMQRKGDTLTAEEPYKRWWSRAYFDLVSPREFTLSAKIRPSEWFSVFGAVGSKVPDEFGDCIANLAHVGFTFGGDFAGHGVYVSGGAVRFLLNDYRVK
jgi:hypothetical protein